MKCRRVNCFLLNCAVSHSTYSQAHPFTSTHLTAALPSRNNSYLERIFSLDYYRIVHESVTSAGYLTHAWGPANSHQCNMMEDPLSIDQNFSDGGYYFQSVNDPNKKSQLFTCALCGKEYTWMYSLRRHQLQCGNKEARNKCHMCSKKFYRRDRLKEHLLAHHPEFLQGTNRQN